MHLYKAASALFLGAAVCAAQPARNEVIGYFPGWRPDTIDTAMSVARIPYDKLTIINYAFWYPRPDGQIVGRDTLGDATYLRGPAGSRLVDRAHDRGVKVMLSLGGWDASDNFPSAASTEAARTAFSASCLETVRRYGFDGIDIDWEYPGFADHHGTPADRANFPLLLRRLRDSLAAEEQRTGKTLLLTAALPAGRTQLGGVDMPAVLPLLDQVNLMTYDYHGTWETVSGHNSPLYASRTDDSLRCVEASYLLYTGELGVPPGKLNIGVPFYGHAYRACGGLHEPAGGPDTAFFGEGPSFSDVRKAMGAFTRRWDEKACVPYLVRSDGAVFVSYDDERSVGLKAEFVRDHRLRGVIIWEITLDYMPDGSTPLLDAVDAVFHTSLPHHQ
jgi:chitinase